MTFGDRMLSVQQVADALGFDSPDPIRRAIKRGELPAAKVCGRIRIDPCAVNTWLQGNPAAPAAPPATRAPRAKPSGRDSVDARPSFRELAKRRRSG